MDHQYIKGPHIDILPHLISYLPLIPHPLIPSPPHLSTRSDRHPSTPYLLPPPPTPSIHLFYPLIPSSPPTSTLISYPSLPCIVTPPSHPLIPHPLIPSPPHLSTRSDTAGIHALQFCQLLSQFVVLPLQRGHFALQLSHFTVKEAVTGWRVGGVC